MLERIVEPSRVADGLALERVAVAEAVDSSILYFLQ